MPPSNNDDPESFEDDTGGFQFSPHLETAEGKNSSESMADIGEICEKDQERLIDIVRLEPTSNSELQNCWKLDSGSQVYEYLESNLKPHYYRDDDSYICLTEEAKDFVRENSGLYQDVTEQPNNSESMEENIQNRDLLMDLVAVAQRLGHLPDEEEIEIHSSYSANRYREEFGDLFQACQEAGIVPDSVTREDYKAATEARDEEESEDEEEAKSSPDSPSRAELIEELQWVDEALGRLPYPSDMNDEGAFSAHIYQEQFGSWDEALDVAGIDKEQELLEDMQKVADKVGKDMTAPEMNEYGSYSSSMAARYFGSWTDAKERFKDWSSDAAEEDGEEGSGGEFDEMVDKKLDDLLG